MAERKRKASGGDAARERMQGAYYERVHLRMLGGRKRRRPSLSASDLRDAVLKKMGPVTDHTYDREALDLLTEFELALREAWERIDACEIRAAADRAIAEALSIPPQWRMPA